jgi:hypothetical protein
LAGTIPLCCALLALVAAQLDPGADPDTVVITRAPGLPHTPRTLREGWTVVATSIAVAGLTPRSLRHFYACGLIALGLDVVAVQHVLGHGSPAVTFNTYSHPWLKTDERIRQASDAPLAQVVGAEEAAAEGTRRAQTVRDTPRGMGTTRD